MVGNNELIINHDTLKLAICNYLEQIGFPEYGVKSITTSTDGKDSHRIFMESDLFGGTFSLDCTNEFIEIVCAAYIKKLIKSPLLVDSVTYTNYQHTYTISLLEKFEMDDAV